MMIRDLALAQENARGLEIADDGIELSVVIPCLNEEEAITRVVEDARAGLAAGGIAGEVIVVDNGSDDRSVELALAAGATVVHEPRRGYGSAYLAGFGAARGTYILMADADGTYPLELLPEFVERLRDGAELVMGSRFRGRIEPGAMPWTNRYIGNPLLNGMLNRLFGAGVSDAHCGLRAIRRDALPEMALASTGMEFASEMIIKAGKLRLRIDEIPIDYRPRIGESKLERLPDAWRHIRFMLVHSPTFLFLVPGGAAVVVGIVALVTLAALNDLGDPWTGVSVAFGMVTLVGLGVIQLGLCARTYAIIYLGESGPRLERLWRRFKLEDALMLAGVALVLGTAITTVSFFDGVKDPRLGILGLTILASSFQAIFGAFMLSILGLSNDATLRRRGR